VFVSGKSLKPTLMFGGMAPALLANFRYRVLPTLQKQD